MEGVARPLASKWNRFGAHRTVAWTSCLPQALVQPRPAMDGESRRMDAA